MPSRDGSKAFWQGKIVISLLFMAWLWAACVLPPAPTATQPSVAVVSVSTAQPPTLEPATPTPELPTATVASTPQSVANVLDQIFPPDKIREIELVLLNCGNCHSWLRPVCAHKTANEWNVTRSIMRDRVPGLSQEDFDTLFDFLAENFNDTKPIPDLPEALRNEC